MQLVIQQLSKPVVIQQLSKPALILLPAAEQLREFLFAAVVDVQQLTKPLFVIVVADERLQQLDVRVQRQLIEPWRFVVKLARVELERSPVVQRIIRSEQFDVVGLQQLLAVEQ